MVAEADPLTHAAPRDPAGFARQDGFAYRFDWGAEGLANLAPAADVVVIVDVLRFTSAVSAAVESGATVLPYPWDDDGAAEHAVRRRAVLAGRREDGGPSLSPTDLLTIAPGTRIVLPSPNGSALTFAARDHGAGHVLTGCLRNATATAEQARRLAGPFGTIAVIGAGERWQGVHGALRPAAEDLLGAGAVLAALDPAASIWEPGCSPEAAAARAAFVAARPRIAEVIAATASARQLALLGFGDDVHTSSVCDVTDLAAVLHGDEIVAAI